MKNAFSVNRRAHYYSNRNHIAVVSAEWGFNIVRPSNVKELDEKFFDAVYNSALLAGVEIPAPGLSLSGGEPYSVWN